MSTHLLRFAQLARFRAVGDHVACGRMRRVNLALSRKQWIMCAFEHADAPGLFSHSPLAALQSTKRHCVRRHHIGCRVQRSSLETEQHIHHQRHVLARVYIWNGGGGFLRQRLTSSHSRGSCSRSRVSSHLTSSSSISSPAAARLRGLPPDDKERKKTNTRRSEE